MLSQLKATILPAGDGPPVELEFKHAYCDEAEPLFDPADSLTDDDAGLGQLQPAMAIAVCGVLA